MSDKILPEKAPHAMKMLIDTAENLNNLLEREANALILMRDPVALSAIESEKENLAKRYEAASAEFKTRIDDFKNMPKPQIEKLYTLQQRIGEKAEHNMQLVGQYQKEIRVQDADKEKK